MGLVFDQRVHFEINPINTKDCNLFSAKLMEKGGIKKEKVPL
jgi:hypothetical protein